MAAKPAEGFKMKKMKRYDGEDGSMVEGDASVAEQMEKMPTKKQSFSEAFAAARDRGDKDFAWEGKPGMKFSTKMREDKPAPKTESVTKTTVKTEAPAPKSSEPAKAEEPTKSREFYRDMSGKMREKTASSRPDLGAMIGSGASKLGSFLASGYQKPEKYMTATEKESKMRAGSSSYAKGGSVSSASRRADGIAQRGKTRGKMC